MGNLEAAEALSFAKQFGDDSGFGLGYEHELIPTIYESALSAATLPSMLAVLRRASGSDLAAWLQEDMDSGETRILAASRSDCAVAPPSILGIPDIARGGVQVQQAVSGYARVAALLDLGICIARDAKVSDHVVIARQRARIAYSAREKFEFEKLVGHFSRGLELRRSQRERERRGLLALSALRSASIAVCVIDSMREIRYQSAPAERFIARGSPLRDVFRRLEITDMALRARLEPLLHDVLNRPAANADHRGGGVWHVKRDVRPQRLSVFPVSNPVIEGGPLAALLIEPVAPHRDGLIEAYAAAHGLSRTETRLLSLLCQGADLKSASRQLGQQLSTTRTVLKSIFAKTETHRQSELVAAALLSS